MTTKASIAIAILILAQIPGGCSPSDKGEKNKVPPATALTDTTGYRLLIGKTFPDVEVIDLESNSLRTTTLVSSGRVVLFLEPTCSFCERMISKWRRQLEDGAVRADEIVAIVPAALETAQAYKRLQGIPFTVYVDTGFVFMTRFQVTDFPLQLVVGRSGTIHDYNFQIERQIFPDQIRRQFAN
jgi:peroxiredoxin